MNTPDEISGAAPLPHLLTVEQLATYFQKSPTWVYRHAHEWPFTRRIGSSLRFDPKALDQWLRLQRADVGLVL
jgi:predicted DNA-binding transcriptional regulator AlpA